MRRILRIIGRSSSNTDIYIWNDSRIDSDKAAIGKIPSIYLCETRRLPSLPCSLSKNRIKMDPVQATMELQDTTQHSTVSTRSSYEEKLARIMSTSNSGRNRKPLNVTNKTFLNNDLSLPSFHDLSHLAREEEEQQDRSCSFRFII